MTSALLLRLDEAVQDILISDPSLQKIGAERSSNVWRMMRKTLTEARIDRDQRVRVTKSDLLDLSKQIDERYKRASERWFSKTALNFLLHRLERRGHVRTSYLNIPQQVHRRNVVTLVDISPHGLEKARALQLILNKREVPTPPSGWTYDCGVWEFLLFYGSLVLSSHLLRGSLLKDLMVVRHQDLRTPGWLLLPSAAQASGSCSPADETYWRNPLAISSRRHMKSLVRTLKTNYPVDKEFLFPAKWRKAEQWPFVLARAWKQFITHLVGPSSLVQLASLRTHGKALALLDGLPPFMIAILACEPEASINPMTEQSFRRICQRKSVSPLLRKRPVAARRRGARHFSVSFHLGFDQVEGIRKKIGRRDPPAARKAIAWELRNVLGSKPALGAFPTHEETISYNVWCFGQWLLQLLLRSNIASGSVLTWTSAIAAHFFPVFLDSPISQWSSQDWTRATCVAMEEHQSDGTKRSFRRFYSFALAQRLTQKSINSPSWYTGSLRKVAPKQPVPIVGFSEFDQALKASSSGSVPKHLRSLLRVMLILGFYCGLRSSEAVRLQLRDLQLSPEPVLLIRDSKTAHGRRNLYLRRLMPARHLREVMGFARHRLRDLGPNSPKALLLAGNGRTEHYDSSYLSSMAGIALRRAIPEALCYHHLRHSFASWMLLRLMLASGMVELDTKRFGFAKAAVFGKQLCSELQTLLYGFTLAKTGQQYTSHLLVVLCRLLGHSHPLTSLNTYAHTTDLLMHLLLKRMSRQETGGGRVATRAA